MLVIHQLYSSARKNYANLEPIYNIFVTFKNNYIQGSFSFLQIPTGSDDGELC